MGFEPQVRPRNIFDRSRGLGTLEWGQEGPVQQIYGITWRFLQTKNAILPTAPLGNSQMAPGGAEREVPRPALPDLGPVLPPPGFCCLPVICLGPQNFPFGVPNSAPRVRSSRHVPIERKHSNDARGLDMLLY
jgi:hypothetical protein